MIDALRACSCICNIKVNRRFAVDSICIITVVNVHHCISLIHLALLLAINIWLTQLKAFISNLSGQTALKGLVL